MHQNDLPRSRRDIDQALAVAHRQLAPIQRKIELLEQMSDIEKEWQRLDDDGAEVHAGAAEPTRTGERAKMILQERPGQLIILRDVCSEMVKRGWIAPTKEARSAVRVALRRLADRDESVERVETPPTYSYRWRDPDDSHGAAVLPGRWVQQMR